MKKVINRKLYDTETATLVGEYSPEGFSPRDFNWWCESLYLKKTGEYFLHGEGGPLSPFSVSYGTGGMKGSEEITPLTYEEARQWAEENLSGDEYLAHFEADEEGQNVIVQASLSPKDKAILDRLRSGGKTISDVISDLLQKADK